MQNDLIFENGRALPVAASEYESRGFSAWSFGLRRNGRWSSLHLNGRWADAKEAAIRQALTQGCEAVVVDE